MTIMAALVAHTEWGDGHTGIAALWGALTVGIATMPWWHQIGDALRRLCRLPGARDHG